jgi:hypothetical protein
MPEMGGDATPVRRENRGKDTHTPPRARRRGTGPLGIGLMVLVAAAVMVGGGCIWRCYEFRRRRPEPSKSAPLGPRWDLNLALPGLMFLRN